MAKEDPNEFNESIEKLPYPWFGLDHGIDNYQDAVLLTEVASLSAGWNYLSGNNDRDGEPIKGLPVWEVRVSLNLKSGRRVQLSMTPKGYDVFLKALKKSVKLRQAEA